MDSILQKIFQNAAETPHSPCLADSRECIPYAEYTRRIRAYAAGLCAMGLGGKTLVLHCTQDIAFLAVFHAIQLTGGIPVPVEKNCGAERVGVILRQSHAAGVLDPHSVTEANAKTDFSLPKESDCSMILYTTGTTGASKGIVLTHRADVAVGENIISAVGMLPQNREVCHMPLNHSAGLRRYFSNMLAGGCFIILDGMLVIKRFFDALEQYNATSVAASPAILPLLFRLGEEKLATYDGKLQYLSFGSAPFHQQDREKLSALLPHCRIYDLYGSTEAGVSCACEIRSAPPHCIGKPTVNARLKIVDEAGLEIQATRDRPGYLCWGGSMCMSEYLDEHALTQERMVDGYIRTSDLGYIDSNSYVYLLGRADDVINLGGMKISPQEIEDIARELPEVKECICKAFTDEAGRTQLSLLYEGSFVAPAVLRESLRKKLEPYKLPTIYRYIPELPRTYNGKLDRKSV